MEQLQGWKVCNPQREPCVPTQQGWEIPQAQLLLVTELMRGDKKS